MSGILKRLDEHIEYHESIDSHKSDVAFFKKIKEHVTDLKLEYQDFVIQYGCVCGHPHCTKCRDSNEAAALIAK